MATHGGPEKHQVMSGWIAAAEQRIALHSDWRMSCSIRVSAGRQKRRGAGGRGRLSQPMARRLAMDTRWRGHAGQWRPTRNIRTESPYRIPVKVATIVTELRRRDLTENRESRGRLLSVLRSPVFHAPPDVECVSYFTPGRWRRVKLWKSMSGNLVGELSSQ